MEKELATSPRAAISVLATQLQVSEYEVFQRAHESWYGEGAAGEVERAFSQYLLYAELPVWVRHFVRDRLLSSDDPAVSGPAIFLNGYVGRLRYRALTRIGARKAAETLIA